MYLCPSKGHKRQSIHCPCPSLVKVCLPLGMLTCSHVRSVQATERPSQSSHMAGAEKSGAEWEGHSISWGRCFLVTSPCGWSYSNTRVKVKPKEVKVVGPGELDLGLRSSDPTQCLGDPSKKSIKWEFGADWEIMYFPEGLKMRSKISFRER